MKNLRCLVSVLALTLYLGFWATAVGQNQCLPGQIETTPCSASMAGDDSIDPGQMPTPPAPEAIDLTSLAAEAITALVLTVI